MNAEIVAIGDELTSGQRLDTNSQWLSQRLGDLGVHVLYHTTVADELDAGRTVIQQAARRADLVIATGGLGPTADDVTRDAIAAAAGCELELDEACLEHIRALFARRKRQMSQSNVVQAMIPAGSRVIPNPYGTAPGIDIELPNPRGGSARLFALPGVPAEMREMWHQTVSAAVQQMQGGQRRVISHRRIKCFGAGVGESDLEAMLPDLIHRGRSPAVGITVHRGTITLRITATAETPEACQRLIEPTESTIRDCLGSLVFGEEDDQLQHVVVRLLAERNQTLATVEWGTGGLLSAWLSEVRDSQVHYPGGMVVRSPDGLYHALNMSWPQPGTSANREALTCEMAQRIRQSMQTDYGLAVSDFPDVVTDRGEPDRLHIALDGPGGTVASSPTFAGHPDILVERSAKQALDLARLTLLGVKG